MLVVRTISPYSRIIVRRSTARSPFLTNSDNLFTTVYVRKRASAVKGDNFSGESGLLGQFGLSAVADCYQGDGESTIHDRLLAKNAYVTSSPGKERARRSLSNTPRKRGFWSAIFGSMVFVLCLVNIGCGPSEPSNSEIAAGMKKSFIRETGAYSSNLDAKAKKIGDGRWAVEMTVEKNGYKRALNATAVMDKHGDIHYHTR